MISPRSLPFILPFTGPPERRNPAQIENDLEDEFAFHLEMKTRELIGEGHEREAARGLARTVFGDLEAIKRQCKRIALEEHVMLQRVNFVMMIVVLAVVGFVGMQVALTQRYNTLALQDITTQLTKLRMTAPESSAAPRATLAPGDTVTLEMFELMKPNEWSRMSRVVEADGMLRFPIIGDVKAEGRTPREVEADVRTMAEKIVANPLVSVYVAPAQHEAAKETPIQSNARVLVEGYVARPGWYDITTQDGATLLHELISHVGVDDPDSVVTHQKDRDKGKSTFRLPSLMTGEKKIVLSPNDSIFVSSSAEWNRRNNFSVPQTAAPRFGRWVQVDSQGQPVADGMVMEFIPPSDLRYRSVDGRAHEDVAFIKLEEEELRLKFSDNYEYRSELYWPDRAPTGGQLGQGRWTWEGEVLIVNLASTLPRLKEPVRFNRAGAPNVDASS